MAMFATSTMSGPTGRRAWIHPGLALAGLFAWLLAFPLFGRFLFDVSGAAGSSLALYFAFAHGGALLCLARLPAALATHRRMVQGAATLLALLTLVYAYGAPIYPLAAGLLIAMGALSAFLILAWAVPFARHPAPLPVLATAMVGANLVLALMLAPVAWPPRAALTVLAALALSGGLAMVNLPCLADDDRPPPAPNRRTTIAVSVALGAFAIAAYFAGGIWYQMLSAANATDRPWGPTTETLVYAAAIGGLYLLAHRSGGRSGVLALVSLSALGVGEITAAAAGSGPLLITAHRWLLSLGFAAADLFYWYQLRLLSPLTGARRAFGIGLGGSVLLIGLANLAVSQADLTNGPSPTGLLLGAALLFLMIPLIFRYPFPGPDLAAATGLSSPIPWGTLPSNLTRSEQQVYALLARGAADTDIAEQLHVSRSTVKFHVRHILRKLDVANRKELLSRLATQRVAGEGGAPAPPLPGQAK